VPRDKRDQNGAYDSSRDRRILAVHDIASPALRRRRIETRVRESVKQRAVRQLHRARIESPDGVERVVKLPPGDALWCTLKLRAKDAVLGHVLFLACSLMTSDRVRTLADLLRPHAAYLAVSANAARGPRASPCSPSSQLYWDWDERCVDGCASEKEGSVVVTPPTIPADGQVVTIEARANGMGDEL
jgi:hypothetical protein